MNFSIYKIDNGNLKKISFLQIFSISRKYKKLY